MINAFIAVVVVWLVCGVIGSGFYFAHFQGQFPRIAEKKFQEDMMVALLLALTGIGCLLVSLPLSEFGKHGWWFWFRKKQK